MPINREEVREFFNGLACKWDSYTPAEDWIVTKIFTNIGSIQNQTVLDVGCGKGRVLAFLLKEHAPCALYGVEINEISGSDYHTGFCFLLSWINRCDSG